MTAAIEAGHWDEVDLKALSEEVHALARSQIRALQADLVAWLKAGVRRDNQVARERAAAIRDRLTRSPTLAEYGFFRDQVGRAWKRAAREMADAGERCPKVDTILTIWAGTTQYLDCFRRIGGLTGPEWLMAMCLQSGR